MDPRYDVDQGDRRTTALGATLIRFVRGASPGTKPILVPSDGDARNAILNARGVRRWSGRCNTAFVPFPNDATHAKEIEAAIAKMDEGKTKPGPIQVTIIEGTLDAQRVVGVVFLRSEVEARLDVMEAAIARVVTIATTNPASSPNVTCSVPTIEKLIATLRPPPESSPPP